MKRGFLLSILLGFVASVAVTGAVAAGPSLEIPLGNSDDFSAAAIEPLGNDQYCLAGDVYHDDVPNTSAMAMLVDADKRRVVWSSDIPYAKSHNANSALACKSDGTFFYVLSQEETDSSPPLSLSKLVLTKISASGKLLEQRYVSAGLDEWPYLLNVDANGISVAGGMNDARNRTGKSSIFFAQFDKDLKPQGVIKLSTGAFWTHTSAKLDGQNLFLAGQFIPNDGQAASGHDGFAVSKVALSKRGYVWSTYVYPIQLTANAAFLMDGSVAYVGLSSDKAPLLLVSLVDAAGKLKKESFSLNQPICSADSIASEGSVLEVIGQSCSDKHSWMMVKLDVSGQRVISVQRFDKDVNAAQVDGKAWVSVVGDSGVRKTFKRSAR